MNKTNEKLAVNLKFSLVNKVGTTSLKQTEMSWSDLLVDLNFKDVLTRDHEPLLIGWSFKDESDPTSLWSGVLDKTAWTKVGDKRHNPTAFNQVPLAELANVDLSRGDKFFSRCDANTVDLHLLILDIDNQLDKGGVQYWSFDDAQEYLTSLGVEAFMYSSYNHLNKDKDGGIDKFRVLIPLNSPCPKRAFQARLHGLREIFPNAANESWKTSQPFYLPLQHPDRKHLSRSAHIVGQPFDWTLIPEDTPEVVQKAQSAYGSTANASDENSVLIKATDGREMSALDWYEQLVDGYAHRVPCFSCVRPEQNASSFFYKAGRFIKHFDGGLREWLNIECQQLVPKLNLVKKQQVEQEQDPDQTFEETQIHKREFSNPKRDAFTTIPSFVKAVLRSDKNHAVIRTPEGYGKSTLIVKTLVESGHKVLFCSASNKQASEKCTAFSKFYETTRAVSLSGLLEEALGVRPPRTETEGFEPGTLLEDETLDLIQERLFCDTEEAKQVLSELREKSILSKNLCAEVVCTTFELANLLAPRFPEYVIVVDDPNTSTFLTAKIGQENDTFSVSHTREQKELVFADVPNKVIWTTTEALVVQLIEHNHPDVIVRNVQEQISTDNHVLICSTKLVRSRLKPVLVSINKHFEKTLPENWDFIANGVSAELNLVSTKGRNDMVNDQVIVISFPHPCEVLAVGMSLGYNLEDAALHQDSLRRQMVVDVLDQALGRAQGYRAQEFSSHRSLIICDPNLEVSIKCRSRYEIKSVEGMKRRGRLHGVPVTVLDLPDFWTTWLAYLNAWDTYVVEIGARIINTLSLTEINGLSPDQRAHISKMLKESVKESKEWAWKSVNEVIEPDEGRRNFSMQVDELLKVVNEHGNIRRSPANKGKTSPVKGKMTFVNSTGEKFIASEGEQIPLGYDFKNIRLKTKYYIDNLCFVRKKQ